MTNSTEQIIFENPKDLVVGENSRFRAESNQSELMESIKQNGILQPIVARKEDKVVIMGNRRLAAATKLGLDFVPVRYMESIDDKTLLILNLTENIQRKDIEIKDVVANANSMLKARDEIVFTSMVLKSAAHYRHMQSEFLKK